jgi:hypothetical protein
MGVFGGADASNPTNTILSPTLSLEGEGRSAAIADAIA